MAKVLIVEDEPLIARMVQEALLAEHHNVEVVDSGDDARDRLKFYKFDLVILDWQLPRATGIEILREFRRNDAATPVLMLTAKGDIDDKEAALESGADDYLTKPFNSRELKARVKALLRRAAGSNDNILRAGDLTLDRANYRVTKSGENIHLVPREFDLLEFFMRNPNRVFSARTLLDQVWSSESDATEEAVASCVKRLRKKIDSEGKPTAIKAIYGVGYRLEL